jgi:hypothetical protein
MGNAYDSASLLVTPNGYRASKIYSAKPTDGSGDLAFSRASTAMRRNSAGLWESVANNVPRLQYPVGGGCPSWLFEPQATNDVLYSTDFSNGNWQALGAVTKTASALATNIVGVTPYDIANLGARGNDIFYQDFLPSTTNNTFQIFIKAKVIGDVGKTIAIYYSGGSLENIVLTEAWQEYSVFGSSSSTFIALYQGTTGTGATQCTISYIGREQSSVATSPIITAGSTVTRLADASNTVIGQYGDTSTTCFVDLIWNDTGNKGIEFFTDDTKRISLRQTVVIYDDSAGQVFFYPTFNVGTRYKIAFTYTSTTLKMFINGVLFSTLTIGTYNKFTRINLGISTIGNNCLFKPILIEPTAISDSEAIELTTI